LIDVVYKNLYYTLPNIQKGKIKPPGRPIASTNDNPTMKIKEMVDNFHHLPHKPTGPQTNKQNSAITTCCNAHHLTIVVPLHHVTGK